MKKIISKTFLFTLIFMLNINVLAYSDKYISDLKISQRDVSCTEKGENILDCSVVVTSDVVSFDYKYNNLVVTSTDPSPDVSFSFSSGGVPTKLELKLADSKRRTYNLNIRMADKDNTLKTLMFNDDEVIAELENGKFNYEADMKYSTEKIKITAFTTSANAKCKLDGLDTDFHVCGDMEVDFPMNETLMYKKIIVRSELDLLNGNSNDDKAYQIQFTRKEKKDTTLKSLKIDKFPLKYSSSVYLYEYTVPIEFCKEKKPTVEVQANSKEATVEIKYPETYTIGLNKIEIPVVNGDDQDTYVIAINVLPNSIKEANLKSLKIKNYDGEFKFDPDTLEYTLSFKELPKKLDLDYKQATKEAKTSVKNNKDLKNGDEIYIVVKLENGLSRTYTLKIELLENNNGIIVALIIVVLLILAFFIYVETVDDSILFYKNNDDKEPRKEKTKKVRKEKVKIEKDEIVEDIDDFDIDTKEEKKKKKQELKEKKKLEKEKKKLEKKNKKKNKKNKDDSESDDDLELI